MKEESKWHDSGREGSRLKIEQKVYIFNGKKTTNTSTLDKWLKEEFDMVPSSTPYNKIKAVKVKNRTFKEQIE